jgi:ribokinase
VGTEALERGFRCARLASGPILDRAGRGIRQTGPVNDFKQNRIAVLGSANMDLVVRQPRLPQPGETMFGSGFGTVPGGKGLNQAVAAARQGAAVDFLGAVGDDPYGRELRRVLATETIGARGLVDAAAPTGTAHISVLDSGENAIVVVSGANATVTSLDAAQDATIRQAAFLVMQCELPVAALEAGIAVARANGVFTVLTPAPVVALPAGFLASVDLVVPNQIEAAELTGEIDPVRAAELLSAGTTWAIVTVGAEGCVVAFDGTVLGLAPARPVTAVDTTAAGDTFVGALVARLAAAELPDVLTAADISEQRMIDAVRWATVASSISVTRAGATSSMPDLAEVAAILA